MLANWKRTLLLTLILMIFAGTAAVWADDVYETIRARKVTVTINGDTLGDQSLNVDGNTLVPLGKIADTVQAIVEYDGNNINIYKPNVHMTLITVVRDRMVQFGSVNSGDKIDFVIHTQVDNLDVAIRNLKFEIMNPNNEMVHEAIFPLDSLKGIFWHNAPVTLQFQQSGQYTIKAYMQLEEKGEYHLVSEKVIQSLA